MGKGRGEDCFVSEKCASGRPRTEPEGFQTMQDFRSTIQLLHIGLPSKRAPIVHDINHLVQVVLVLGELLLFLVHEIIHFSEELVLADGQDSGVRRRQPQIRQETKRDKYVEEFSPRPILLW